MQSNTQDSSLFVTTEMVNGAFSALYDVVTNSGESAQDRIDAARMLIEYGGVRNPLYLYPSEPEGSE